MFISKSLFFLIYNKALCVGVFSFWGWKLDSSIGGFGDKQDNNQNSNKGSYHFTYDQEAQLEV